ncbi:hypothetical protein Trydic_g4745 [Trypoxylus dichotomus]
MSLSWPCISWIMILMYHNKLFVQANPGKQIAPGAKDAHIIKDDGRLRYGIYQNLFNCDIDDYQLRGEDGGVLVKLSSNKDFVLRAEYSKG